MLTENQKAVITILSAGLAISDASQITGISRTSIYRWLKRDGFCKALHDASPQLDLNRGLTRKQLAALELFKQHRSLTDIAEILDVTPRTVYTWRSQPNFKAALTVEGITNRPNLKLKANPDPRRVKGTR